MGFTGRLPQKQYRLKKLLSALERVDLLIVDELGYLSLSESGAELLFRPDSGSQTDVI